jgi:uncharacterized protein
MSEIQIYIDADATPRDAVQTTRMEGAKFGATVWTVSSINHHFEGPTHITVDAHSQAVDMEIVRRVKRAIPTIVVTQDYGLAALVLGKGSRAISPRGLIYTDKNIDQLLFERELHAHERKVTGRSKGPKARTKADSDAYQASLTRLLETMGE